NPYNSYERFAYSRTNGAGYGTSASSSSWGFGNLNWLRGPSRSRASVMPSGASSVMSMPRQTPVVGTDAVYLDSEAIPPGRPSTTRQMMSNSPAMGNSQMMGGTPMMGGSPMMQGDPMMDGGPMWGDGSPGPGCDHGDGFLNPYCNDCHGMCG